jgi:putative transposase
VPDARRCVGRSRGGLTTKLHAAVDRRGRPRRLVVTAGQRGDAPRADVLLEGFGPGAVGHVVADAAYDSDAILRRVRRMGAKACIRPNPTRKTRKRYDRQRYRNWNVVERFFGRIKCYRRVGTRYEKKAVNFAGFV